MKKTLLIAGLVAVWSAQADASTWINGFKYPDGCKEYRLETGVWGVKCPSMNSNPQNKYWSNREVKQLPGHASRVEIAPEPKFQKPVRCKAAAKQMESTYGNVYNWFRRVRYGTINDRVLTGPVAKEVYEQLRSYTMQAIDTGQNKYRFGTRYEDRDGACADHIEDSRHELLRIFNIVKAEAAKGNRDLIGTGLNPRPSKFNR